MRNIKFTILPLLLLSFTLLSFGCISRTAEPKKNDYLDDKVTAARVLQLLKGQPDYKYPDIHVAVTNGVVYLNGSVQRSDQKFKAEELAQRAENVRSVKNNLTLKQSQ
jgi:osmotically-inducible protein OsmY